MTEPNKKGDKKPLLSEEEATQWLQALREDKPQYRIAELEKENANIKEGIKMWINHVKRIESRLQAANDYLAREGKDLKF